MDIDLLVLFHIFHEFIKHLFLRHKVVLYGSKILFVRHTMLNTCLNRHFQMQTGLRFYSRTMRAKDFKTSETDFCLNHLL